MQSVGDFLNNFHYVLAVICNRLAVFFSGTKHLYTARFAHLYELMAIFIDKSNVTKQTTGIFLAIGQFDKLLCLLPKKSQKELGNVLIIGTTRRGKGLNIGTNLLRWHFPALVNDIKQEHWNLTAGFRETGLHGKSFKFDPRGIGHRYDPLDGKKTDFDLRSAATVLLHRSDEGQNAVFTERAITMLTQIFIAARLERERALPFTYKMLNEGLYGVVSILEIISEKYRYYPNLATKFLDINGRR